MNEIEKRGTTRRAYLKKIQRGRGRKEKEKNKPGMGRIP